MNAVDVGVFIGILIGSFGIGFSTGYMILTFKRSVMAGKR